MNTAAPKLFQPLTFPNGKTVPNRLCKAAMEENLSDEGQIPGDRLHRLYRRWVEGGVGLILTGNVMVAPDALTGPGGVVLQESTDIEPFKRWAEAGKSEDGQFWMQINHPGRQVYAAMGETALSPSDKTMDMGNFSKMFAQPRAMTEEEIEVLIQRFTATSKQAELAGFTGVQVHAAHGYLISQFLSPLTNLRSDQWGGDINNRARVLIEIVKRIRQSVKPEFCVSVKLNSADFQRGGFELHDAKAVIQLLNELNVDLVELSGGSYESPAMQGRVTEKDAEKPETTLRREAYFVDFAREIASVAKMPIMVTGGILRRVVAEQALEKDSAGFGVEMLGLAQAMAFRPDLPNQWREHELEIKLPQVNWKNKTFAALAVMSVTKVQLKRLAQGKSPKANVSPFFSLIGDQIETNKRTKRYRRWRENTAQAV
ncbi:NADH:flavin oxidoreductase/NADH oxidase family protein [Pseudomonadales bacterium]|jgi:2,4-dienoyl-CoA reductase-like NADH-dependent reductase (Old Yellow Enzyme family)|nr:NADH:flavin oxidoreductase/NADH oxidase family protein [Pseudomonadales bacterium]MDA9298104.1 NADH:flavin oxidoreductase/NADH oxidase family protein [Pseudomonadales bacterium]MDB4068865.1 NADH:flavin oxidoreductase/NADH oxidase family protein [Pseudomonadales bacterium]MDB9868791.1 NADH:flavin oxidoreductase/NADH oxidase family protein [Pseudomonadales bacterium]MDB9917872.1 NADH:flavin oxidoreductase/NADH oxidase family protein [Pseudomonadales bacterium]